MNALLEQFLSESRDFLQGIGEKLMQLEADPESIPLMTELFRFVHTLKGNSGLFDFPEMTRVLHASEDLMDAVRHGRVKYSQDLTDQLLDAMDFVGILMDEIESTGRIGNNHATNSVELAKSLRELLAQSTVELDTPASEPQGISNIDHPSVDQVLEEFAAVEIDNVQDITVGFSEPEFDLTEDVAAELYRSATEGASVFWVEYIPESECFFKGEDPFYLSRQVPAVLWCRSTLQKDISSLAEMDVYSSQLGFQFLTIATQEELDDIFRYVPDQIQRIDISALAFVKPSGIEGGNTIDDEFISRTLGLLNDSDLERASHSIRTMLELSAPELWSSSVLRWTLRVIELDPSNKQVQSTLIHTLRTHDKIDLVSLVQNDSSEGVTSSDSHLPEAQLANEFVAHEEVNDHSSVNSALMAGFHVILEAQKIVLSSPPNAWSVGRLKSVAATLIAAHRATHQLHEIEHIEQALQSSLTENSARPLLAWLDNILDHVSDVHEVPATTPIDIPVTSTVIEETVVHEEVVDPSAKFGRRVEDASPHFGRRAEDSNAVVSKTLKVDQEKIDRLMNLIGEMVVAKNALPYLANRAETVFGVRDLSREIKAQYAVINRVAEEMQDTIMQVRMMPVSFIFQRFPRMVRDISRKLGKEVELVLEGESTEADKNIIEALSDPLIHIVRNSLDHGLEAPEVRVAAGKNATGKLLIRATQESDRVLIEIIDDGRGINPSVIKQKAYEKGLIDESALERISDEEAVNLVFAAGFSTADVISDLSGRGVGMDVVRSAVERINGTVGIESEVGKGTRLYLSLPLSMAVTNVMIIESNQQIFGVPMDMVVETVRVPRAQLSSIKQKQTTVLRGRIVPLLSLNELLALPFEQVPNEDDEFATLVVRVHGEHVGIIVDDFRETVDIILKPMTGILGGLGGFSGAALLGDGSVLMVLNPRELI